MAYISCMGVANLPTAWSRMLTVREPKNRAPRPRFCCRDRNRPSMLRFSTPGCWHARSTPARISKIPKLADVNCVTRSRKTLPAQAIAFFVQVRKLRRRSFSASSTDGSAEGTRALRFAFGSGCRRVAQFHAPQWPRCRSLVCGAKRPAGGHGCGLD